MKMSKLYMPTLREVPAEAELPSHQLFLRAGMMRKLASGVYSYLPMGYRVIRKIEEIVRQEMDNIDSQETLMPAILPAELWKESGRWSVFGPEMFTLNDRHGREFCLGPTHEEIFTDLIRHEVKSYKQLPLSLYQIQTKYRDEKRPRFGLMRCREFIMKDAYTFDRDPEAMKVAYFKMWDAYKVIFDRCKLDYKIVEGDSGAMGGNASHEFIAMSEIGESEIAFCNTCDYAATDEKAECAMTITPTDEKAKDKEKVHTPGVKTITALEEFFKTDSNKFIKTLLIRAGEEVIAVLIPGGRDLNEVKLLKHLGIAEHEYEMATEEEVLEVTGAATGFAGPIGLKEKTRVIIDSRVTSIVNGVTGANETDYHTINVNFGRDFDGELVDDLLMVVASDNCPKCEGKLQMERGNEVGNIFQLGTKYSDALGASFLDENGKKQSIYMGSHGVGVSRTMAAVIEQYNDEKGIIWPLAVAPYHVIVTVVNSKKEDQAELGEKIYNELKAKGIEVLLDDRKERAGVKFTDAELIGIPVRVNVGRMASENVVEFAIRREEEKIEISVDEIYGKIMAEFDHQGFSL
ncbi:MAG: proline--tRNA ligase [Acidaminobacteraceae bacterium]